MKKGACYVRVSTDDQAELSPATQIKEIRKYARDRGILLNEEHIFIDEGISGRKTKNRPAFQQMIGTAKKKPKPFDMILLWKFSRFARNQEEAIVYKSLLRRECGIEVISITEPVEDSPFGSLIERIIEWFDAYYSIRLGEDVKRSMTEKARRGEFQTAAPFGYTKKKGRPLQIETSEAPWVQYIFRQFSAGSGCFSIAGELNRLGIRTKQGNPFESRAVEYILNNPVYIGYVRWTPEGQTVGKRIWDSPNTITEKGGHPPIITESLWKQCRERIRQQKKNKIPYERPAEKKKHRLSGLVKCGVCGSTMTYSAAAKGFQCAQYSKGACPRSQFISAAKIEKMLFGALAEIQTDVCYRESKETPDDHGFRISELRRSIARAENKEKRAKTAYIEGLDSLEEYRENKAHIAAEIEALRQQLFLAEQNSGFEKPGIPETQKLQEAQEIQEVQEIREVQEMQGMQEVQELREIHGAQKMPEVREVQKMQRIQEERYSAARFWADPNIDSGRKYRAIREITEKITFKRPEEEVCVYFRLR